MAHGEFMPSVKQNIGNEFRGAMDEGQATIGRCYTTRQPFFYIEIEDVLWKLLHSWAGCMYVRALTFSLVPLTLKLIAFYLFILFLKLVQQICYLNFCRISWFIVLDWRRCGGVVCAPCWAKFKWTFGDYKPVQGLKNTIFCFALLTNCCKMHQSNWNSFGIGVRNKTW